MPIADTAPRCTAVRSPIGAQHGKHVVPCCRDCQRRLSPYVPGRHGLLEPPPAQHDGTRWGCDQHIGPDGDCDCYPGTCRSAGAAVLASGQRCRVWQPGQGV